MGDVVNSVICGACGSSPTAQMEEVQKFRVEGRDLTGEWTLRYHFCYMCGSEFGTKEDIDANAADARAFYDKHNIDPRINKIIYE